MCACRWGEQSDDVFDALAGDFMKPRIQEVDQLLKLGVNVTVYSGQVFWLIEPNKLTERVTDETDPWLALPPQACLFDLLCFFLDIWISLLFANKITWPLDSTNKSFFLSLSLLQVDLIWATKGTMDWVQKLK